MACKADRKKLKKEYVSGGVSFHDLAMKYKISDSTVKRWAKDDGWTAARAEADAKAEQKIIEQTANQKSGVVAGVIEVSEKLLKKLAEALENETGDIDPARLRQYTGALKDLQDIRGDRSKLDLKEQKARIARLQQSTKLVKAETKKAEAAIQAGTPEGRAVTVELLGDVGNYGS